ncbi:MAG: DUF4399 domain-containing protein [Alcanivoracaceae bacterium]
MTRFALALLTALAAPASLAAGPAPAPEGAALYFITPQHGDTVTAPVKIRFGLRGMGVAPAGVNHPHTGHHHLLVNLDALPPMDQPLPASDQIIHFGGGQTEATLDLPPGEHRLQLLLGDHFHIPHLPPLLSEPITIRVK